MATLRVLSLSSLRSGDSTTINNLNKAVCEDGFFYLDFQDCATAILEDVISCRQLAKRVFSLPLQEKMKYDIDRIGDLKLNGYKPEGRNAGVAEGKPDGFEAYLLAKDDLCDVERNLASLAPQSIVEHQSVVTGFAKRAHEIGLMLLEILSRMFSLDPEDALEKFHRLDKTSTGAVGMLRYPQLSPQSPSLGHSAHTDVGSLTILFCDQPGLQIFEPGTDEWKFVQPRVDQAIVNVGDSLRFLTNRQARSCLHRVVPGPGATVMDRYSIAYFMRPEVDAVFKDENDEVWTSVEWHMKKYKAFRADTGEQRKDFVLTGRTGDIGQWTEEVAA